MAGGACCGGNTAALFDDRELAALAHAGTRPRDLVPPAGDDAHAGCAFRGPRRCTLEVAHRPARCVHYVCATLRHEIRGSGAHADVQGKLAELQRAMQRFVSAHRDGVDRETLAPIVDAIAAARDA